MLVGHHHAATQPRNQCRGYGTPAWTFPSRSPWTWLCCLGICRIGPSLGARPALGIKGWMSVATVVLPRWVTQATNPYGSFVTAVLAKQFRQVLVPPNHRGVQRRGAVFIPGIDLGLAGQQQLHYIVPAKKSLAV